jgi:hypothetical protein
LPQKHFLAAIYFDFGALILLWLLGRNFQKVLEIFNGFLTFMLQALQKAGIFIASLSNKVNYSKQGLWNKAPLNTSRQRYI